MDAQQQILAQIAQLQAQLQVLQQDKGLKWCNLIESFNKDKRGEAIKELGGEMKRPIMSRPIDYIRFARQYVIDMGYEKKVKPQKKKPAKKKKQPATKGQRKSPLLRIKQYEELYMEVGEMFQQTIPAGKKMKGTSSKQTSTMVVEWTGKDFKDVNTNIHYKSLHKATEANMEYACGKSMKELDIIHKQASPSSYKTGPTINAYGDYKACGFGSVKDLTIPIAFRDCNLGMEFEGREWDRQNVSYYISNYGDNWCKEMLEAKRKHFSGEPDDEVEVVEVVYENVKYYKDTHGNVYDEEENLVGQWENDKIKFSKFE